MGSRSAVVGGFVLGGLALGVVGVIVFGGARLFAHTARAVTFFEGSVAGLDVGAPVTFRGVRLGSVIRIALDYSPATGRARIPVTIEVEPDRITWEDTPPGETDYSRLAAAGLRAQLASQSLVTGQLRVDLDFRPDTPMRMVGVDMGMPEIPAIPSELELLRTKLTELPLRELVETAQRALASVDRFATRLDGVVDPVAGSVRRTADTATNTLETADAAVRRVQDDLTAALRTVNGAAADARRQLDGRGGELSRILTDADRSLRQIDTVLASANGLVALRSSFRGDLEAAMRDLSATASALRTFARTVERDPSAMLTGRTGR